MRIYLLLQFHHKIRTALCLVSLCSIALSGCYKAGPDYVRPESLSTLYGESWISVDETCAILSSQQQELVWWQQLNDPELSRLMRKMFAANFSLAQARERIVEARARRGVANADRLPSVYLGGYTLRTKAGDKAASLVGVPPGQQATLFAGAALAGWELDLWGRVARMVEAADHQIESAYGEYHNVAASLSAELALAYINARAFDEKIALTTERAALLQDIACLAEEKQAAGLENEQTVLQARSDYSQAVAEIAMYEQSAAVARHQIAVLTGEPPKKDILCEGVLPQIPQIIGLDVPAKVLSRRPDVRAAEHAYAASVAQIGAKMAEKYPRVALGGLLSFQTTDLYRFFNAETLVYTFGGGVALPIFTGGKIDADIRVSESQAEQSKLQLKQTVLEAVGEVEDAAVGVLKTDTQTIENIAVVENAAAARCLVANLRSSGLATQGEYLAASVSELAARDALVSAKQQEFGEVIRLYRALGGSWEKIPVEPLPQPAQQVESVEAVQPVQSVESPELAVAEEGGTNE